MPKGEDVREQVRYVQAVLGTRYRGYRTRTTTAVARALLLEGAFWYRGESCDPIGRKVGPGVWEIELRKE